MKKIIYSILIFTLLFSSNLTKAYYPVTWESDVSTPATGTVVDPQSPVFDVYAIKLTIGASANPNSGCLNDHIGHDANTTGVYVYIFSVGTNKSFYVPWSFISTTPTDITFVLPDTVPVSTGDTVTMAVQYNHWGGGNCGSVLPFAYGPDSTHYGGTYIGQGIDNANIYWNSSSLSDGSIGPDFNNWPLCYNIGATVVEKFYIKVLYSDAGSVDINDNEDDFSTIPIPKSSGTTCLNLPKQTPSAQGNVYMEAYLYDYDTDDLLSGTGLIRYVITGATTTDFPEAVVPEEVADPCDAVNNFIIRGGCNLIVPNSGFAGLLSSEITDTKTILFDQAPFAYFTEIESTISDIDITEDTSDLSVVLPTPFGESEGSLELKFFDDDNPLLPLLDDIRPWIIVGLWLSFATYLSFRVFSLFRAV